jgi:hypothetical protein
MKIPIWVKSDLYKSAQLASTGLGTASEQVQYWAQVGRACIDNPDLPVNFVIDSLESLNTNEDQIAPFTRA